MKPHQFVGTLLSGVVIGGLACAGIVARRDAMLRTSTSTSTSALERWTPPPPPPPPETGDAVAAPRQIPYPIPTYVSPHLNLVDTPEAMARQYITARLIYIAQAEIAPDGKTATVGAVIGGDNGLPLLRCTVSETRNEDSSAWLVSSFGCATPPDAK